MLLDRVQQAAQEQFSRRSERYGNAHILADVTDVTAALQNLALPAPARVLDVAAGAGHTGLYLASLGHEVTLTDLAEPMLASVREAAVKRGLDIQTRQHAAEELPYADAAFDLVTCRVAAHHFSSPERFIAESARVLRERGFFLLIDGSVADGEPQAEDWIHQLEKLRDPSHHRFLTPHAWSRLCEQHGLSVRRAVLHPLKQPDLDWYFDTAATPPDHRARVRDLIATAPAAVRRLFRLGEEDGKTIWWWQRLTLIAERVASSGLG